MRHTLENTITTIRATQAAVEARAPGDRRQQIAILSQAQALANGDEHTIAVLGLAKGRIIRAMYAEQAQAQEAMQ
jgi:hypothetical protein